MFVLTSNNGIVCFKSYVLQVMTTSHVLHMVSANKLCVNMGNKLSVDTEVLSLFFYKCYIFEPLFYFYHFSISHLPSLNIRLGNKVNPLSEDCFTSTHF